MPVDHVRPRLRALSRGRNRTFISVHARKARKEKRFLYEIAVQEAISNYDGPTKLT